MDENIPINLTEDYEYYYFLVIFVQADKDYYRDIKQNDHTNFLKEIQRNEVSEIASPKENGWKLLCFSRFQTECRSGPCQRHKTCYSSGLCG